MDKTEPEFMNHRKVCHVFDCSLRLNVFLLLQPQMRGENIKAVVFTKCLLMIIPLYLSYIFMVSEGLSLMGISNIQMVCFEYIFPDLLSSTSQMTNKQNKWLSSCFCRGETTVCCVLFNQARYYGRNLQP